MAGPPTDTLDAFRAFCHRLGSPLGALVNHAYLLGMDADALPEEARPAFAGVQASIEDLKRLLEFGRLWIDTQRTDGVAEPLDVTTVAATFDADLAGSRVVHADPGALARLAEHLDAHGTRADARETETALQFAWSLEARDVEDVAALLDPFAASPRAPRWGCAQALANAIGATLEFETDGAGVHARLSLPFLHRTESP